jgi:hypothetical protein
MKRKETWKQDSPQMQLGELLQSVYGNFCNLHPENEFLNSRKAKMAERCLEHLLEACEIARALPDTSWEVDRKRQKNTLAQILAEVSSMTSEERLELFGNFCPSCGSDDPGCQCWNDD